MSRKMKHMGMSMTEDEHEKWHREHGEMTPQQHEVFTKKMGISEEEHSKWHSKHEAPQPGSSKKEGRPVNPYAIG
jgi:hypothetical protein